MMKKFLGLIVIAILATMLAGCTLFESGQKDDKNQKMRKNQRTSLCWHLDLSLKPDLIQ